MSKVTKAIALFFAALMLFISIGEENYSLLLSSSFQKDGSVNSGTFISSSITDLFFLNNLEDRLVSSFSDLPGSKSKNNLKDFCIISLSPYLKSQSAHLDYLSYSEADNTNLTIKEIIYPFHYFW